MNLPSVNIFLFICDLTRHRLLFQSVLDVELQNEVQSQDIQKMFSDFEEVLVTTKEKWDWHLQELQLLLVQ